MIKSGEFLDYYAKYWKVGKMTILPLGPLFNVVLCNHPDALKISLAKGTEIEKVMTLLFMVFFTDPKADFVYFPLMPWLGKTFSLITVLFQIFQKVTLF